MSPTAKSSWEKAHVPRDETSGGTEGQPALCVCQGLEHEPSQAELNLKAKAAENTTGFSMTNNAGSAQGTKLISSDSLTTLDSFVYSVVHCIILSLQFLTTRFAILLLSHKEIVNSIILFLAAGFLPTTIVVDWLDERGTSIVYLRPRLVQSFLVLLRTSHSKAHDTAKVACIPLRAFSTMFSLHLYLSLCLTLLEFPVTLTMHTAARLYGTFKEPSEVFGVILDTFLAAIFIALRMRLSSCTKFPEAITLECRLFKRIMNQYRRILGWSVSLFRPRCYQRLRCFTKKAGLPAVLYTLREISRMGYVFLIMDQKVLVVEGSDGNFYEVQASQAGNDGLFVHISKHKAQLSKDQLLCVEVLSDLLVAGRVSSQTDVEEWSRVQIISLANPNQRWSYRKNGKTVHVVRFGSEGLEVAHVRSALAELPIPILSNLMKAALGYAKIPLIYDMSTEIAKVDAVDRERVVATIFAKSRLAGIRLRSYEECVCYTHDQDLAGPFINVAPILAQLILIGAVRRSWGMCLVEDPENVAWITKTSAGSLCVTPTRSHATTVTFKDEGQRVEKRKTETHL